MSMEGASVAVGGRKGPTAPLRVLGDEALVRMAARGSESAFSVIFDRHHQALYRYAMTILGNRDDSYDAVQNAFVSLLRSLPGEKREIKLKPWLFRIVHNEAITLIRQRGTSTTELSEEPAVEESPEDKMLAQAIITDLSTLGAQQRSAVAMRELNGLSHAEIGAALGVSEAAAKQAVYEGRVALQQIQEGREMSCAEIQRSLSANDRRLIKGRRVRSHLRDCPTCRAFQESIAERRVGLAAIAPLPAALSGKLLAGIFGGGGGPAGGLMVGAGAGAGAAQTLGLGTLAKVGISTALLIGGGVAIERGTNDPGDAAAENGAPPVTASKPAAEVEASGEHADRKAEHASSHHGHSAAGKHEDGGGSGGTGPHGSGSKHSDGGGLEGGEELHGPNGNGGDSSNGGSAAPAPAPPVEAKEPPANGPDYGQSVAESHDPGDPGNSASHSQEPADPPGLDVPDLPPTPNPQGPKPGDLLGHGGGN
jgi:RNA polymerase sigma factor (sigma-70 family)